MRMPTIKQRTPWTPEHDQQVIDLYNMFLTFQRNGEKYQKAKHVRALAEKQGRSAGSIEAKLMNVSAVRKNLLDLDIVQGYKALDNYAHSLAEAVCKSEGFEYERK